MCARMPQDHYNSSLSNETSFHFLSYPHMKSSHDSILTLSSRIFVFSFIWYVRGTYVHVVHNGSSSNGEGEEFRQPH